MGSKRVLGKRLVLTFIAFTILLGVISLVLSNNLFPEALAETENDPCKNYGDFNGDGFKDLAIGVPLEDINGIVDAGAVNIIYGSVQGIHKNLGHKDQFVHQDSIGIADDPEEDDHFGEDLAAGDFNGDGFDDLVIGVKHEKVNGKKKAGAVHVIYGSALGLHASNGPGAQFWHQDSPGIEDQVEAKDKFGNSLIAGDFNNDGFDDLAIGVKHEKVNGIFKGGAVNVIYGSAQGLHEDAVLPNQFWHQDSPGIEDQVEDRDKFGNWLLACDFNGDGFDDLAIDASAEDINGKTNAGAVNVIYGSALGLHKNLGHTDQFWHQDTNGIINKANAGDEWGYALTAGDFNNDGFNDLAASSYREDTNGNFDAGAVNVIYGSAQGLHTDAGLPDQFWHQNRRGIADSAEENDLFGKDLGAGDFNNDGYDDLAIGVWWESLDGKTFAGAVNVIYGSDQGLHKNAGLLNQFWHQDSDGIVDQVEAFDIFGLSLIVGDFNGDGYDDLGIGVPGEDKKQVDSGAVNVIYGSAQGLHKNASLDNQFWHQDRNGIASDAEAGDKFGRFNESI